MSKPAPPKILLVINADTNNQLEPPLDRSHQRLADYTALKAALQADIVSWPDLNAALWIKGLAKISGKGPALAILAFLRRKNYDRFYCDSETEGILLALLFKLSRTHKPLYMLTHRLSPFKKAFFFKYLHIQSHINTLFVHSTAQYDKVTRQLGVEASKVQLIPYQIDTEFWQAAYADPTRFATVSRPYICTAGLEFRDYPTLIEAVRGLNVDLKIGAASLWSKRQNSTLEVELPFNVEVRSYSHQELRDLYAGSAFVVVPLYDVDFQAGITVILEAMGMGKAVIVTRTQGQTDTVVEQGEKPANDEGRFIQMLGGSAAPSLLAPSGYYFSPGNINKLRQLIQHLLAHPEEAQRLGLQGRKVVESLMDVEQFAERIKQAILLT